MFIKGYKMTQTHKDAIGRALKGRYEGRILPESTRIKMCGRTGNKNASWKGGKAKCIDCGKELSGYKTKRCKACDGLQRRGSKCHLWNGGTLYLEYPREFNASLKAEIRDRDNHICQGKDCGVPEIECYRKLDVHHIDYNKKNNSEVNFVSLCSKCHLKANTNRKYWEEYFTQLMISKIKIGD